MTNPQQIHPNLRLSLAIAAVILLGGGCPTPVPMPVEGDPTPRPVSEERINMSPTEALMKKDDDMLKLKADGDMETLTEPMVLSDGTKVMPTGEIMKPDGEKKIMNEGESITMEGEMVKVVLAPPREEPSPTLIEEKKQMMRPGSYEVYDKSKLTNAENATVVLFFHAAWCPTCRAAESNFRAASFPDGLTILKIDYDTATDLKLKYGITYQHTYVQVDAQGNLIKKWSRSTTLDEILGEVNA